MTRTTLGAGKRQTKQPFDWRQARAHLFKYFRSPSFWAHTVLIFTSPFWMPAAIYLYFRSFVFAPGGFWAWFSIITISAWIVYRIAISLAMTRPLHLELKAARKALADGDAGCEERLERAKKVWRQNDALLVFAHAPGLIILLIPPIVALVIWSTLQLPVGELVHGKLVIHSRSERLQTTLRWFESRGLFTRLVK